MIADVRGKGIPGALFMMLSKRIIEDYAKIEHSAGGLFALYKNKHGFVIGGMPGLRYKEYTLQMEPGDKIFVYTDGVPEATADSGEMFGVERMTDALNVCADGSPADILRNVTAAVEDFVGDAEQFDDMTMMCLEYNGPVGEAGEGTSDGAPHRS